MNRLAWQMVLPILAAVILGAGLAVAAEKSVVTLMTHDSFALSEGLLKTFEEQHQVSLKILKSGDAGAALNQAILSRGNPMADVFFGVDNTFLARALAADIFEPYASPLLARIPATLQLDSRQRLLPVDYGDVCLNVDREWFAKQGIQPPQDLGDLLKPEYKGLTVVQNPATSSPGMAFLLTTVGRFGDPAYLDFWRALRANEVYVANGWSDAYFSQFTRAKNGTRPIVVSYASSPAAEVHFSKTPREQSPTEPVLAPQAAFRQIEFVGVLRGTRQPELARKLVDFFLSPAFQQEIPLQMWVYPADPQAALPEVFTRHARIAEHPVSLAPEAIDSGREKWLNAWTDTVLR